MSISISIKFDLPLDSEYPKTEPVELVPLSEWIDLVHISRRKQYFRFNKEDRAYKFEIILKENGYSQGVLKKGAKFGESSRNYKRTFNTKKEALDEWIRMHQSIIDYALSIGIIIPEEILGDYLI